MREIVYAGMPLVYKCLLITHSKNQFKFILFIMTLITDSIRLCSE